MHQISLWDTGPSKKRVLGKGGRLLEGASDSWATPSYIFDALDEEFRFQLDVCADAYNHKCDAYFDIERDGLNQKWAPYRCWCNPPYKYTAQWLEKAFRESLNGATVVCLVNVSTGSRYWHRWVIDTKAEVRFIEGRIKFIAPHGIEDNQRPTRDSAIIVYRPPFEVHKL